MTSEQLKEKWKDPQYRQHMIDAHKGQKAWNAGIRTGLVPKTAFKVGHKQSENWYKAMSEKMSGENNPSYKHGKSGTKEYFQIQKNNRRVRKLTNGGKFTLTEWSELKNKYNNICLCCLEVKQLEPDHVIPLSKGGSNSIENIQPLCRSCNNKKYVKSTDYRVLWQSQSLQ